MKYTGMKYTGFLAILLGGVLALPLMADEEDEPTAPTMSVQRPNADYGPTRVEFLVFVIDIDAIDGANQSFAANVFIYLRWKDPRLADLNAPVRQMRLEKVWSPKILLVNKQGIVRRSMPRVVTIEPDGTVTYRQRYVGPLSQPLYLSDFPLDKHTFTIQFAAVGHARGDVEFVPGTVPTQEGVVGGAIADTLSLPDWKILSYKAVPRPYRPISGISVAGFAFEFTAKRYYLYYVWQVMVPLIVIVAMSWAAFWIDPSQAGTQIAVATSAILSLIAYRFVLASLLPRLPYMTRMDYFTLGSTLLVFFALVEVILTSVLARGGHGKLARAMDRAARIVFPVGFLALMTFSSLS